MHLRRRTKIGLWCTTIFAFVAAGLLSSIAWFDKKQNAIEADVTGSVVEEYFHCGTGTQSDPYVITRPIHYYHLVEFFQRLTNLPKTGGYSQFGTDYLYFQVGYDLDGSGVRKVYNYSDTGVYLGSESTPSLSTTLNMAYYSGENALLPIGTNEVPFIGSFDGGATNGGGITINNLNIQCSESVLIGNNTVTRTASDIGVFGYVADKDGNDAQTVIQNAYFTNLTLDLSDIGATANTSQSTISHIDSHTAPYVGYIVGHVHSYTNYNGTGPVNATPLHDVYVNGTTILGGAGVNCNYGYIGKVDTVDGQQPAQVATEVTTHHGGSGMGEDNGGSLPMKSLYNRLLDVYDNYAIDSGTHTEREISYLDSGGNVIRTERSGVSGSGHFKGYSSGSDYSYTFNKEKNSKKDYMFLYGDVPSSITSGTATTEHVSKSQVSLSGQPFAISYSETLSGFLISATSSGVTYYLGSSNGSSTVAFTNMSDALVFTKTNISGDFFSLRTTYNGAYRYLCGVSNDNSRITLSASRYNSYLYKFYNLSGNTLANSNSSGNSYFYVCYRASDYLWVGHKTMTSRATFDAFSDVRNYYLGIDSSRSLVVTNSSSESATWLYYNNKIVSILNDSLYYLTVNSSSLFLTDMILFANATTWSISASGIMYSDSGTTYYLHLAPSLNVSTTAQAVTTTNIGDALPATNVWQTTYIGADTTSTTGTSGFPNTYMPLNVSEDDIFSTMPKNTGYIVSGKASAANNHLSSQTGSPSSSDPESSYYNAGDIRVSRYAVLGNIDSTSTIYTIGTSGLSTSMSGFKTYTDAKSEFDQNWDNNWIYGLHFMDSSISENSTTTISNATINSTSYASYVALNNSITFRMKKDGFISFFAGTYFSVGETGENNTFFSLYEVTRDPTTNAITDLTAVSKVCQKTDNTYEYNTESTGSTVVFDSTWITNPTATPSNWVNRAIYFFEIPVHQGEYALGSVSGKNGAYLMYLDIGAFGVEQTVDQATGVRESALFTQIGFSSGTFMTNSVFNVAFVIPVGSDKDKFSITVSVRENMSYNSKTYTCYDVVVVNTSGSSLGLSALLMDNDNDPNNEYLFMYSICYNGGTTNMYTGSNSFTGASGATSMTPTYT